MFNAVLSATFRLLTFRAGPQDFPFSPTSGLTRTCVVFAIVAIALPELAVASPFAAVAFGGVLVLSLFIFTRVLLRMKKLENRFQQAFNALLCSIGALWLLALPAWAAVLPTINAMQEKLIADPTLSQSPERLAALQAEMQAAIPPGAAFMIFIIGIWQFAVTARVLGQSTDTNQFIAAGLAVLCLFNMFAFMLFAEPLLQFLGA
jgi:hypothetical protein